MADEIDGLRELMDHYRRKAETVGILPLAAAYGEAANQIEEMIVEIGPAKQEAPRQACG